MSRWLRYLGAAFNARPLGMPVPPNWLGLAAVGMLGALAHPAFLLIGAGLEVAYLGGLVSSRRFRTAVDATAQAVRPSWDQRRSRLLDRLPAVARGEQEQLEERCAAIARRLETLETAEGQIDDLARLCWLNLRLLTSREDIGEVVRAGERDEPALAEQERHLAERLGSEETDERLRASLEEQRTVIGRRRQAHHDARHRLEVVNAELERIRQQAALVHEQALLAGDAEGVGQSVDMIAASLDEAGRWLHDQQALLGQVDDLLDGQPDGSLFRLREQA